ncbi:MAG: S-adenosylmethionine:tRNA ribosyltransferase-isomerase [Elusimicrobiota bacterium]
MEILKTYRKIEYDLPPEKIALYPADPRDLCRLMVIHMPDMIIEDRHFTDITDYFNAGDVIAVNNSRVIPARLHGRKQTGGNVEFLLLEQDDAGWKAMGRPAARMKKDTVIEVVSPSGKKTSVKIKKKCTGGIFFLETPGNILDYGYMPLPPYIVSRRKVSNGDKKDYQTNFAECDGSVASPTSALHFTDRTIRALAEKGVVIAPVTLHVGPGTFKAHYDKPDPEKYSLSIESAERLNESDRICVCGTTVMRTLESVYDGVKYNHGSGETGLFITPGHTFSRIKMFLTNFHLHTTPLIQLVAAFIEKFYPGCGPEKTVELYRYAIENNYRFLSYGDAMLIIDDNEQVSEKKREGRGG